MTLNISKRHCSKIWLYYMRLRMRHTLNRRKIHTNRNPLPCESEKRKKHILKRYSIYGLARCIEFYFVWFAFSFFHSFKCEIKSCSIYAVGVLVVNSSCRGRLFLLRHLLIIMKLVFPFRIRVNIIPSAAIYACT